MILELEHIKMSYTNTRKEVFNLLGNVNMGIEAGSVTALIGGNGAGKTTLFNIISGFEKRFSGQVKFKGKDIAKMAPYKISRMGIGRLFQGRQLMDDLTLLENMKIASDNTTGEKPFDFILQRQKVKKSESAKEQKAEEVLTKVFGQDNKYLEMLDRKASELSYGEQRLLALASLLMRNDELLLLDEPTSGVNLRYIESFKSIIRELAGQKKTVLLIEHNMPFVRDVADKCFYLSGGEIIRTGSANDVLDDEDVRKDYLGL